MARRTFDDCSARSLMHGPSRPLACPLLIDRVLAWRSCPTGERLRRITLLQDDRVLLFHHDVSQSPQMFGEFSGFTFARGAATCASLTPAPESACAHIYRHTLEVAVPGGATATLAPGMTQNVGGYIVHHGTTESFTRFPETSAGYGGCADLRDGPTQVTAVWVPAAP